MGDDKKETNMVGPSDVNMEAVSYLESMVETLNRRDEELRKKQSRIRNDKKSWNQSLDDADDGPHDRETLRETISALEDRLREIDEKLSLIRFRHSLAEAMLTQIFVVDTVQTWEEFYPRGLREDVSDLSIHGKRAIAIGIMVDTVKGKTGYHIKEFDTYKECFKEIIPYKYPLDKGYMTTRGSLDQLGIWEAETEGEEAENLQKILLNCVHFMRERDWRPENADYFAKHALENLGRRD
ncbi:hypothetical protein [Salinibacter sp.]|uniref:hypothetical protein n=1 Tax=Salinibacter sp. TaxID=2065818 RepID=UPI0035D3E52B